jgi:hypothetical protein
MSLPVTPKTFHLPFTVGNQLALLRKKIPDYCQHHKQHTNTLCEQNADVLNIQEATKAKMLDVNKMWRELKGYKHNTRG